MRYLSKNEVKQSLQNAAKYSSRDYTALLVLAKTGIRSSELTNLTPNDILDDENQLVVRGKGGKVRNIKAPIDVIMQLEVHQKNARIKPNKPFFPITPRTVQNISRRHANINPHAFRHSYAIVLLRKTRNIRYVQKQLGHSTLDTTAIYLQFAEYEEEDEKLGELYA